MTFNTQNLVFSALSVSAIASQKEKKMANQIVLDLTKKLELNLNKAGIINIPVLQTRAAIDRSGSMQTNFDRGFVSKAVDLFTVAALKFDDNQSLELGFFNDDFTQASEAQEGDVGQYMKTKGKGIYASGGTSFAPIIDALESRLKDGSVARVNVAQSAPRKGFFGRLIDSVVGTAAPVVNSLTETKRTEPDRGYVGIITDGQNADKSDFERKLASTSGDTFFQFIGIGKEVDNRYLEGLAAKYKHVDVFFIPNPTSLDDEKFYELVCNKKFTTWCKIDA